MSQIIVAAAGAAVGFAIGGPQGAVYGYQLGSTLGALAFSPSQKVQGPRLSDLKVSGTEYGAPIPYVEGTVRTSGQVIWSSDRREIATTTEQAGKGGPSVESTTYTYEVDMLYMLSDCELAAVSRVWINGKLAYNNLATASVQSAVASLEQTEAWKRITFYSGAADQLPDPTYEAAVGVGNAPAYRGRACVFIEGLQLGSSGQIPNLSFEVMREKTTADVSQTFATINRSALFAQASAVHRRTAWYVYNESLFGTTFKIMRSKNYGAFKLKQTVSLNFRYAGFAPFFVQTNGSPRLVFVSFSGENVASETTFVELLDPETGAVSPLLTYVAGSNANVLRPERRLSAWDEVQDVYVMSPAAVNGADRESPFIITTPGGSTYTRCPTIAGLTALAAWDGHIYALAVSGGFWRVRRYNYSGTFVDEVVDTAGSFNASGTADQGSRIRVDSDGQCWVFNTYRGRLWKITTEWEEVSTAANVQTYNSNDYDGVFYCTEDYVAFGFQESGTGPYEITYTFRRLKVPTPVDPTLQAVVERLCARSGLSAAQYDASALASVTSAVRSMAISQVTPVRQVLETLASPYFFGCVLSEKLYLRPRGGSSVATIPYSALGAGEDEAKSEPLQLKQPNELEVPAQIALTYNNLSADYNSATEYSDRLIVGQTSTNAVQVPLGFTPSQAKGIADAITGDYAAARVNTSISLLSEYTRLEPTDVITVVDADGSAYRMRIERKTESGPVLDLDLVLDDASVLVSAGITAGDYVASSVVNSPASTLLRLLDIPQLRDGDDPVGIYVAVAGESTPWPGAALFKSVDGSTYEQRQTISDGTAMGFTTTALTDWAGGFVFDQASSVTVEMAAGTLSSYTRDQIFDGTAKAYLVGSEILYATTATLVSEGIYTLSGFLRGLRGTEWAMTGHVAGEEFTVLSTSGLRREQLEVSEIAATRYYKAPTLGRSLSSADEESITVAGVSKKPFSPVGLRGQIGAVEPFFSNVSLLLHFDGTNGQNTTVDSGNFNRSVSLVSSTLSTTLPKFGTASLSLTGNGQYAQVTRDASLEFGSGDFTVECWAYPTSAQTSRSVLAYHVTNSTFTNIQFLLDTTNSGSGWSFQVFSGSNIYAASGGTQAVNQWQHVAAVRSGSTLKLYVDGIEVGSVSVGTISLNAPASAVLRVGGRIESNVYQFLGRVDDVRITKGVARYTANFTPPTEQFPDALSSSGIVLSWDRRTRLAKNFSNGYVPLGEESESYEVDIWSSNTYAVLKRTVSSSSPTYTYSAAQQIADFGSLQTALYVDVYQVSATVGRGYKLRGAV